MLATVLKCFCADKFQGMEQKLSDRGVYEFIFDNDAELIDIVNKFNRWELLVEPATFASILRLLKNMLYNAKQ